MISKGKSGAAHLTSSEAVQRPLLPSSPHRNQPEIPSKSQRKNRSVMFLIAFFTICFCQAVCGMPQCYPPDAPLLPAVTKDCTTIIDMMLAGDKSQAPMRFSRIAGQGYQVPHRWVYGSCVVLIDLVEVAEDTMSISTIANTALGIMHLCVGRAGTPGLGGREYTGPKDKMLVLLAGRTKRRQVGGLKSDRLLQLGRERPAITPQ